MAVPTSLVLLILWLLFENHFRLFGFQLAYVLNPVRQFEFLFLHLLDDGFVLFLLAPPIIGRDFKKDLEFIRLIRFIIYRDSHDFDFAFVRIPQGQLAAVSLPVRAVGLVVENFLEVEGLKGVRGRGLVSEDVIGRERLEGVD